MVSARLLLYTISALLGTTLTEAVFTRPPSFEVLLQEKCVVLPHRTYFDIDSLQCFIRTAKTCSTVVFPGVLINKKPSAKLLKKITAAGILKKDEKFESPSENICVFQPEMKCPEEFTRIGDGCYYITEKKLTWDKAADECHKRGAHLLSLHNDEQTQQTLYALIEQTGSSTSLDDYYLGLEADDGVNWQNDDYSQVDFYRWNASFVAVGNKVSHASVLQCSIGVLPLAGYQRHQPKSISEYAICYIPIVTPTTPVIPTATTTTPKTTTTEKPTPAPKCCPETGIWSEWGGYTPERCVDFCGSCGTQTRTRICTSQAYGCPCQGLTSQTLYCGRQNCLLPRQSCCLPLQKSIFQRSVICGKPDVVDVPKVNTCGVRCCPELGIWSEWSNRGQRYDKPACALDVVDVYRTCLSEQFGCKCTGVDTRKCADPPLPPVVKTACCDDPEKNGLWNEWSWWSTCTATCGLCGTTRRTRTCASEEYGCSCKGMSEQTKYCGGPVCPGNNNCAQCLVARSTDGLVDFCQEKQPTFFY